MDKDGIKFFLFFFLLGLFVLIFLKFLGVISIILALVPFIISLFILYFFRDPPRTIPEGEDLVVSPADGQVVEVKKVNDDFVGNGMQVSIFMSPFDVHINRVPLSGKIVDIERIRGKFLPAYREDSATRNARVIIRMKSSDGYGILVRQIAGIFARRVVCRLQVGMQVTKGQKMGLIRFGSRAEIIFPERFEVKVRIKQKVKGGMTIIAKNPL